MGRSPWAALAAVAPAVACSTPARRPRRSPPPWRRTPGTTPGSPPLWEPTARAGYQLATGDAVMAIGGFNGTDPWPTLSGFEKLVGEHEIHYFIAAAAAAAPGSEVRPSPVRSPRGWRPLLDHHGRRHHAVRPDRAAGLDRLLNPGGAGGSLVWFGEPAGHPEGHSPLFRSPEGGPNHDHRARAPGPQLRDQDDPAPVRPMRRSSAPGGTPTASPSSSTPGSGTTW